MINIETKNKTGRITIKDFSKMQEVDAISTEIACAQIYNFNTDNKSLKNGMGIRVLTEHMENNVASEQYPVEYGVLNLEYFNKVMYFKQYFSNTDQTTHRLLVHGSDGKLYMYQMFSWSNLLTTTYDLAFDSTPVVLAYKKDGLDAILISTNDKLVVWETGRTPYELSGVPTITSMCVYNDVLYCTIAGENSNIWYTTNLHPETIGTEADGTAYLTMDVEGGGGSKIVVFKENVYIFRDYGISRLNTYVRKEPTTNLIYLSDSKIYANTVCECGDYILFATCDGVYRFSGATVTKIDKLPKNLTNDIDDYAVSTGLQDNYYLALKLNFDDGMSIGCENCEDVKNNVLLRLNLNDYSFEIMRGVDIKDMLSLKAGVEEKVIVTFNSEHKEKIGEIINTGACFESIIPRAYRSNYVVQEDIGEITIRKIMIDAMINTEIKITTEQGVYNFNTYCDGINQFQTIIPCKKFKFEVSSSGFESNINLIQFEYVKRK